MMRMDLPALLRLGIAVVLSACAVLLSAWIKVPWPGIAALGILFANVIAAGALAGARRASLSKWGLRAGWACTIVIPVTLLFKAQRAFTLDGYYAALAWAIAAVLFLTANQSSDAEVGKRWKLLGVIWAFCGGCVWIFVSYEQNLVGAFYAGLLVILALLILCKFWFAMPLWSAQLANTLILIAIGLPAVDLFVRPSYRLNTEPKTGRNYYSYEAAKRNPTAFARWWNYYLEQWHSMGRTVFIPDPEGFLPFRLRPNSRAMLFHSQIEINSQGFRGKEFSSRKNGAFRIVALGESTTFGCTLNPEDRPWPELLEGMIRERIRPARPVEVINAGVPSYALQHNNHRLPAEILPLEPDMIISYHGYNGFSMLYGALPPPYGYLRCGTLEGMTAIGFEPH